LIVLDTHAFVWMVDGGERLSPAAQRAIAADAEPALDVERAVLWLEGDREIFEAALEALLETTPALVATLRHAAERADVVALRSMAHSLKGSAASVCAEPVRRAAERLERLDDDADLVHLRVDLAQLDEHLRRVAEAAGRLADQGDPIR